MQEQHNILNYLNEHLPFIIFLLTIISGAAMWLKHKIIDDIFVTRVQFNKKFSEHEKEEFARYDALDNKMDANHNELKDLIINNIRKI